MQQAVSQPLAFQACSPLAVDPLEVQRPALQFLQAEVRELSKGWMFLTVEKACRESS